MLPEQIHHVVDELLAQDKSLECLVPPRPEEPLPQDCCGCSCEPCVFDLYRDDLDRWAKTCLRTLKPDMVDSSWDDGKENLVPQLTDSLEPNEYRPFKITSVTPISKDTNVYRFELRKSAVLSLPVGKHLIMRYLLLLCDRQQCLVLFNFKRYHSRWYVIYSSFYTDKSS